MSTPQLIDSTVRGDTSGSGPWGGKSAGVSAGTSKPPRACTNCVRAKAKCTQGLNSGDRCERCEHSNKLCQPSPPMRKRQAGARHPANKVGKLEQRLDGLVALLKYTTPGVPACLETNTLLHTASTHSSGSSSGHSTAIGDSQYNGSNASRFLHASVASLDSDRNPITVSSPSVTPSNRSPFLVHPALEPSPEDADSYLSIFRTEYTRYLPFVVIAPSVSAQQLRRTNPFLWLCIMTVASTRSSQQVVLSRELRILFGREAYLEGTRSLDLLLACLVYATWDRRYNLDKPILASLVQLAVAILYDLGLDKPASDDAGLMLEYDLKGFPRPGRYERSPTLEERRALLGCFLLSSVPSFARKGQTLPWTAYCTECLLVLEREKESSTDELLVRRVRLRLVTEKVSSLHSSTVTDADCVTEVPAMFHLKSLQAQLRALRSRTLDDHREQKILLLETHITDLAIHEVGFSPTHEMFTGQANQRFECLYGCLQAIRCWIDVFLSIPPSEYVGFSACIYAMMARCLIDLWRLSTCEHAEWDRGLVRDSLDIASIFEQTENRFMQVKEAAGLDRGGSQDDEFFGIMASKLRLMKVSWDASNRSALSASPVLDELLDFPTELLDTWDW